LRRFFGRRPVQFVAVVVLLAVVVAILFMLLNWYVAPTKPTQRKDLVLALAQILGGAALLSGVYFTWRTLQVDRKGQITERFTRAIDQLGALDDERNKLIEIRIGGIYALGRVARESEEDYWTVMEVLTAYVRKHSPRNWSPEVQEGTEDSGGEKRSAEEDSSKESERAQDATHGPADPDIQAIITVLRRIRTVPSRHDSFVSRSGMMKIVPALDLHETNLTNANLMESNLRYAIFRGADLKGTRFWGADLKRAELFRADLKGAQLQGADLEGAFLKEADLEGAQLQGAFLKEADLEGAQLQGANLSSTNLTGANFRGANLKGATLWGAALSRVSHLTQEQLEETQGDETTQLPASREPPAHW
jgi:hypothetical protein